MKSNEPTKEAALLDPSEATRRTHHRPRAPAQRHPQFPVPDGRRILYLSIDIETDGPIVGVHSMLSIGVAGFDLMGNVLYEFERNLLPLEHGVQDEETMKWWAQPEQAGAWQYVNRNREHPKRAFAKLAEDMRELKKTFQVTVVCSPAAFDWPHVAYYMHVFVGENPLGRTAKCAVSYVWAMSKCVNPNTDLGALLQELSDPRYGAQKHRALEDARAQGARFVNALREMTRHGPDPRAGRK